MLAHVARLINAPLAALMRLLRTSAESHPLVYAVSRGDEHLTHNHS